MDDILHKFRLLYIMMSLVYHWNREEFNSISLFQVAVVKGVQA